MDKTALRYFTAEEIKKIRNAIRYAEENTSGEIRVHVEKKCSEKNILDRAAKLFANIGMHKTGLRNGVLFYIAFEYRQFAIIGDAGINSVVEPGFWDGIRDVVQEYFKKGEFALGLCNGIEMTGLKLKKYFPHKKDDINELPDEISTD